MYLRRTWHSESRATDNHFKHKREDVARLAAIDTYAIDSRVEPRTISHSTLAPAVACAAIALPASSSAR
eukprot:5637820-Pleurochrysis_carterae.AAC.2